MRMLCVLSACAESTRESTPSRVPDSQVDLDSGEQPPESDAAGTPSACHWDRSLDDPDAERGACRAHRTILMCGAESGTIELCLSDDPNHCPAQQVSGSCRQQWG